MVSRQCVSRNGYLPKCPYDDSNGEDWVFLVQFGLRREPAGGYSAIICSKSPLNRGLTEIRSYSITADMFVK